MNLNEEHELEDLVKLYKKIVNEINKPDGKLREVFRDIEKTIPIESFKVELLGVNGDLSRLTNINNIDDMTLYNKLPIYRDVCFELIVQKGGKELL